jgi:MoaA/NifB/PqqE/SkfB family radical SAM enzyme
MCPRKFAKVTGKNMPLKRFKYILDVLQKVRCMILLGGGETLMNPYFFGTLNFGKSRDIHFTVANNGMLLIEKNINGLNNVSRAVVSIDHPYQEGYKKI